MLTDLKYYLLVCAFVLGIGGGARFVHKNIITALLFKNDLENAFVGGRVWEALGFTFVLTLGPFLPVMAKVLIFAGLTVVSMLCMFLLRFVNTGNLKEESVKTSSSLQSGTTDA